jgi:hypothetical protein
MGQNPGAAIICVWDIRATPGQEAVRGDSPQQPGRFAAMQVIGVIKRDCRHAFSMIQRQTAPALFILER